MPTLADIKEQVKKLDGASKFLGRREINELPKILWEDETVLDIVQGTYNAKAGILVATNTRLIFVDKGMLYGLTVEDFSYDKVNSIQYSTGMLLGGITIFSSGNKAEITNVNKDQCRLFCDNVRSRIGKASEQKSASTAEDDIVAKLERLAKLKEQGILTAEEFQTQKSRILSG